jgi:hypothetical protein
VYVVRMSFDYNFTTVIMYTYDNGNEKNSKTNYWMKNKSRFYKNLADPTNVILPYIYSISTIKNN